MTFLIKKCESSWTNGGVDQTLLGGRQVPALPGRPGLRAGCREATEQDSSSWDEAGSPVVASELPGQVSQPLQASASTAPESRGCFTEDMGGVIGTA